VGHPFRRSSLYIDRYIDSTVQFWELERFGLWLNAKRNSGNENHVQLANVGVSEGLNAKIRLRGGIYCSRGVRALGYDFFCSRQYH
jgi:hypothetical protein